MKQQILGRKNSTFLQVRDCTKVVDLNVNLFSSGCSGRFPATPWKISGGLEDDFPFQAGDF